MAERYWIETLGCPKNQVDSDKLVGTLVADGYEAAGTPDQADLVVVNTCAFIEAARQESVDTVLSLSDARRDGARLVVTGCMAERYGDELADGPARGGSGGAVRGLPDRGPRPGLRNAGTARHRPPRWCWVPNRGPRAEGEAPYRHSTC